MADKSGPLEIPNDWSQAVRLLWDLEQEESLPDSVWARLIQWLSTADFNGPGIVAGETAALLIRDKAPEKYVSLLSATRFAYVGTPTPHRQPPDRAASSVHQSTLTSTVLGDLTNSELKSYLQTRIAISQEDLQQIIELLKIRSRESNVEAERILKSLPDLLAQAGSSLAQSTISSSISQTLYRK